MNSDIKSISLQGIDVFYSDELDGGGSEFGQDYIPYLAEHFSKPIETVFEFCAGPGFIGFALLGAGICKNLCLADINPKAIDSVRMTIRENHLENVCRAYESNIFEKIPDTEKWDLIVGNPPHSNLDILIPHWGPEILYRDHDWQIHKRFFCEVRSRIKIGGSVILQENSKFSSAETFRSMVENHGLSIAHEDVCKSDPRKYFLWCVENSNRLLS